MTAAKRDGRHNVKSAVGRLDDFIHAHECWFPEWFRRRVCEHFDASLFGSSYWQGDMVTGNVSTSTTNSIPMRVVTRIYLHGHAKPSEGRKHGN